MSKELKKYELKACPRPLKSGRYALLSNTVAVRTVAGNYYAYVTFSDALVDKVGRLVLGLMKGRPAFLSVTISGDGKHDVWANGDHKIAPVFSGPAMPEWLKLHKVKVKKDGHEEKSYGAGKRRLSPRDGGGTVIW